MATDLERLERIQELRDLPARVEEAVSGLDDARLDTPYREGGWTVRQVVHHIADSHLNGYVRMRLALTEAGAVLKTYDQDAWADLPDAREAPLETSIQLLRGVHGRLVSLLERLPADSWNREANHPEAGVMTVDDMLGIYAGHGRGHLDRILELRSRMGW